MYVRQPGAAAQVAEAAGPAYVLSSNKFFVDELYDYLHRQADGGVAAGVARGSISTSWTASSI